MYLYAVHQKESCSIPSLASAAFHRTAYFFPSNPMQLSTASSDEISVTPDALAHTGDAVMEQIANHQLQAAWQRLKMLVQQYPQSAHLYRLQGGILELAKRWDAAMLLFRQALALNPQDSQTHTAMARCLHRQGDLPQALQYYRQALRCQCQQPMSATAPHSSRQLFDHRAAEDTLWQVLTQLAAAGVHAFASSGTLLGLVREGHLLPFDKDLDIGLPFGQMEVAAACLKAAGWQRKVTIHGLVNPQAWHGHGVALDLCGFALEPASGKVIGGFWFQTPDHPWSRVTEYPELKLQQIAKPHGKVWHLVEPEAILVPLYGQDWRVPDPDFDSVIAAHNLRGCSLLAQCYAFSRIYSTWVLGQTQKARSLVRHALRHLPEDALLHEVARLLGMSRTNDHPSQ